MGRKKEWEKSVAWRKGKNRGRGAHVKKKTKQACEEIASYACKFSLEFRSKSPLRAKKTEKHI